MHGETRYEVTVDWLVGEYRGPQIGDTKRLFAGQVTGGTRELRPSESVRLARFRVDRLTWDRPHWQPLVMRAVKSLSDLRSRLMGRA